LENQIGSITEQHIESNQPEIKSNEEDLHDFHRQVFFIVLVLCQFGGESTFP